MPSYCLEEKTACVKLVNVFPENRKKNIPSINAQILVMDSETGLIQGILDGTYVTQLRTGGATGVAIEILATKECIKGALIGTGGQAATQLEAMLIARKLKEVQVFSSNYTHAQQFSHIMAEKLVNYGASITAVSSPDIAVHNADIVITATTSTSPVFDSKNIKAGAIICGIGSYKPYMQELPSSLMSCASKIYFDSRVAVLSEAGDIIIPIRNGTISKNNLTGELGDVIGGRLIGRENDDEIIIFKSVGISAQDLIVSKSIFNKAKKENIGFNWE